MSIYDDFLTEIPNDYLIFDGQFTASYTQNGSTISVAGVTQQKLSLEELQMLGGAIGMEPTLRAFSLPTPTLAGVVPQGGDMLVDAESVSWSVKSADESRLGTRWIVYCQRAE